MALEQWLPELKVAVQDAQKCLDDCKTVRGMVNWEKKRFHIDRVFFHRKA
jgi:hypothetical protein